MVRCPALFQAAALHGRPGSPPGTPAVLWACPGGCRNAAARGRAASRPNPKGDLPDRSAAPHFPPPFPPPAAARNIQGNTPEAQKQVEDAVTRFTWTGIRDGSSDYFRV